MKQLGIYLLICVFLIPIAACSTSATQEVYWKSGMGVALDDERKGNIQEAETGLRVALGRAERELDDEQVASSLYNLGGFYLRQYRLPEAIYYLGEALPLADKVSGPQSELIAHTLVYLAAAYANEGDYYEGRPYANRLKSMTSYFSGEELAFMEEVLQDYVIDTEKYQEAVANLKPLADAGDSEAQYQLAAVYFDGPEAEVLMPEILDLYKKSAALGYVKAQYYLGVLYDKGRGVQRDDAQARKWYRTAAENGDAAGQYNYAVFLGMGRGGPANEGEAWEWVNKSADQGFPPAQMLVKKSKM